MASKQLEQFGDLVQLTLDKYIRSDYTNLLTDLQRFPAASQLVNKSRMSHQAGTQIRWQVRLGTANSYEHITPTTPDQAAITDDFDDAYIPFRKVKVSYAFLEEMVDFQAGPEKIVDLVKAKEAGADHDFIEGIERDYWAFPSASDTNTFRSLPYWVVKSATSGFTGGHPTGYSDVAGLSATTYPRWKNYAAPYTAVTLDDFVLAARTMAEKTFFEPSVANVPDLGKASPNSRGYYTTLTVKQTIENIVDSRNDNLGFDIASSDGKAMFRRAPVNWVPVLDADTTNPFYQINWDVFKTIVKTGYWNARTVIKPVPGMRNMVAVYKDTWMNFACFNRRVLGVLSTGTTYPS